MLLGEERSLVTPPGVEGGEKEETDREIETEEACRWILAVSACIPCPPPSGPTVYPY